MSAVSGVVSQKRQLLPVETHQPRPEELHPRAAAICYDEVGRQRKDGQQHDVPLDEKPRINLLVKEVEEDGGDRAG